MKFEDVKKLAHTQIENLLTALKNGRSEQLTAYLTAMAKFHRYSATNSLLIFFQKPDATHVAGFATWKKLGRFVKPGERGIAIMAPMRLVSESEEITSDSKLTAKHASTLRFRAVHVFDISQTDGEPLPAPASMKGTPNQHLEHLEALISRHNIALACEPLPFGTDGVSEGGRIVVRPDLSAPEKFGVLVHELAHELLHRGTDRPESKTVRECEAEAVAFVVASAIELDPGTACSDYISLYQGNEDTLLASLERIQTTAVQIIQGLLQ